MKYIRTENGIYKAAKSHDGHIVGLWNQEVKILAEADTIEELCDEYVLPKFREVFAIDRFSKQVCINHIKCGNGDVYGAIWTSKGLIYVAKMNDEGVLEFI